MITTSYQVAGMTCGHCVSAVTQEINAIVGVHAVIVDLTSGNVTVQSNAPLSADSVSAAIDEAGYRLIDSETSTKSSTASSASHCAMA